MSTIFTENDNARNEYRLHVVDKYDIKNISFKDTEELFKACKSMLKHMETNELEELNIDIMQKLVDMRDRDLSEDD